MKQRGKAVKPKPEDMLSDTLCRCGCELGDHRANTRRECLKCGACDGFRAKPVEVQT